MKRKLLFKLQLIFISTFFIISCASIKTINEFKKAQEDSTKQAEENPGSYIKTVYAGVDVIMNEAKECEIISTEKGSPADIAGLQSGDIIKKMDGKVITSRYQAFRIYNAKSPEDIITVEIKRDDKLLNKQIRLDYIYMPYDFHVMMEMISREIPIRVAVVAGNMKFDVPSYQSEEIDRNKKMIITEVTNAIERGFIIRYKTQNNFSIVDRQYTETILRELKFQESGLVSKEYRNKLGEMLGATHLLIIDYTFIGDQIDKNYHYLTRKFIEVESGKVLSNVSNKGSTPKNKGTAESRDFIDYINKIKSAKINILEKEALSAWSNVTGSNFSSDSAFYNTLVNTVIPKYSAYAQQLVNISPATSELKDIHNLQVEGAHLHLQAFSEYKKAIDQKDYGLIVQGDKLMQKGREKMEECKRRLNEFIDKHKDENLK